MLDHLGDVSLLVLMGTDAHLELGSWCGHLGFPSQVEVVQSPESV
jgi:hypothetical protein